MKTKTSSYNLKGGKAIMGFFSRAAAFFTGTPKQAASWTTDIPYSDIWGQELSTSAAGVAVNSVTAARDPVVWRCVNILADLLTLPITVYKLRTPGFQESGMDASPTHPLQDVLSLIPNRKDTAASFWRTMGFHAALRGVAYAEIKPGQRGAVDRLIPLHPDLVVPELIADDIIRYRVTDWRTGVTRTLLQEEIFRIPGLMPDGVNALNPTIVGADAIGLDIAMRKYASSTFSKQLNMGGFFVHPGKLSDPGRNRLVEQLIQRFSGPSNFFRPMILQEGMDYKKASMTAQESQLTEERKAQISDIARIFGGIPLHMLGVEDGSNRATAEEQSINFGRFTARPFIVNVEQAIQRQLILAPRLYVALFNLDEIERGNMAVRGEFWGKALGSGGSPAWLTVNDVRKEEGWNPVDDEGADKLAIGTNPQTPQNGQPPAAKIEAQITEVEPETPVQEPVVVLDVKEPEAVVEPPVVHPMAQLVRKEIKAINRLAARYAGNDAGFKRAVVAFYGGFSSNVMEKLGISKEDARIWTKRRAAIVISSDDISITIESFEDELEKDLKMLSENKED